LNSEEKETKQVMSPVSVVVVSGLPRSGTSMAMRMLEAGGVPIFADGLRLADEDNPNGYYELERVKTLDKDTDYSWLGQAQGKAIKIVSHLIMSLPAQFRYKVLFLNRAVDEVVASQNKMLSRNGQKWDPSMDRRVAELFKQHLREVKSWMACQSNLEVLHLDYAEVIRNPEPEAQRLCGFLRWDLDWREMAKAVDPGLYRNRSGQRENAMGA
jgi:hypothetical protein